MNEIIKSILDKFTHLLRDLLFYFISGFLVLIYFYYLFLNKNVVSDNNWYNVILVLVLCYAIGQLCMIIFKLVINDNDIEILKKEINVFDKNKDAFFQYIERYNTLYHLRGTLFVCFLLICFLGILYLTGTFVLLFYASYKCCCYCSLFDNIFFAKYMVVSIISFFSFIISIIFFIGSLKAHEKFNIRIEVLNNLNP